MKQSDASRVSMVELETVRRISRQYVSADVKPSDASRVSTVELRIINLVIKGLTPQRRADLVKPQG